MTVSRRQLLAWGATAAACAAASRVGGRGARRAGADPAATPRNLIIVLATGGWDTTYALDPKPGNAGVEVPPGMVAEHGDLAIYAPDTARRVGDFFDRWAPLCAVIRGIYVQSLTHPDCLQRTLTGGPGSDRPDVGAIAGHALGSDTPIPYLILSQLAFTGPLRGSAGRLGYNGQIVALLDPAQAYPAPPGAGSVQPGFVPTAADEALIRDYVRARTERLRATRGQRGHNRRMVDDFATALERGDVLADRAARWQPGALDLLGQANLAVEAIERRVSRAVMIGFQKLQWDSHALNTRQAFLHDELYVTLDHLVQTLHARPGARAGTTLFDETVVLVCSEMGRAPLGNADSGKDHWPVTSALVLGGGVAGGRAYGGTDDQCIDQPVDLATGRVDPAGVRLYTANVLAGVLELVGVDSSQYLPGVEPLRGFAA